MSTAPDIRRLTYADLPQVIAIERRAAKQMPLGLDSSSTNIARDHGVGNARRSIAMTCGRSA